MGKRSESVGRKVRKAPRLILSETLVLILSEFNDADSLELATGWIGSTRRKEEERRIPKCEPGLL